MDPVISKIKTHHSKSEKFKVQKIFHWFVGIATFFLAAILTIPIIYGTHSMPYSSSSVPTELLALLSLTSWWSSSFLSSSIMCFTKLTHFCCSWVCCLHACQANPPFWPCQISQAAYLEDVYSTFICIVHSLPGKFILSGIKEFKYNILYKLWADHPTYKNWIWSGLVVTIKVKKTNGTILWYNKKI